MRRSAFILPLLCALSLSCGSITSPDDDDDDDVTLDAARGAGDASGARDAGDPDSAATPDATPDPDAPPLRTACGEMTCLRATEICVYRFEFGPVGPPKCEPVPEGCEDDRSCDCVGDALCTTIASECHNSDGDNAIRCECPICG